MAFDYVDATGAQTRRQVDPLGLCYMDRSTVLVGWCHLRGGVRVFRLDRMRDLSRTGASFRPARVGMLRQALVELAGNRVPAAEPRADGD